MDTEAAASVCESRLVRREVDQTAVLATVAMLVVVLVMAASQGGPGYFIGLGERSTALDLAREVLGEDVSVPLADGHDGESFWLLARDPTLSAGEDLAQYLDRPLYRAQRIGYPLLASPWGLFGEQVLLWGLVLTNVAAAGIGTWLVGRHVTRGGGPSWAGYVFVANPVVWVALLFDFSDAVALTGLVGFVAAVRARRTGWAAASATMAALAKESSALGIAAVVLLARGPSWRERVLMAGPAATAVSSWRFFVMSRPGFGSDPEFNELKLVPFSGYAKAWQTGWVPNGLWLYAAIGVLLVPLAGAVLVAWWRRRGSVELTAALPYAAFLPFLSSGVLSIPVNSVRAIGPAITLGLMGVLRAGPEPPDTRSG